MGSLAGRPKLELEQDRRAVDRLDGLREFYAGINPDDAAVYVDDAAVFDRYRTNIDEALAVLRSEKG